MGRRKRTVKRGSYQSLGAIQENNAIRMADANLTRDKVLAAAAETEIEGIRGNAAVDAAVQDAMEYLPTRRAQLSAMGITEDQALALGELRGNVPMPVIQQGFMDTTRTHVDYDVNPITGQREVVPIMNPDRPNEVLKTSYGPGASDPDAGHQSEPGMANAFRLLGGKVSWNDPVLTNPRNGRTYTKGKSDLKVELGGSDIYADVMVDRNYESKIPVPLYTSLYPEASRGPGAANKAEQLVRNRMSQQGDADVYTAVEDLVSEGVLGPGDNKRFGKLARANKSHFAGDALYDMLIMPGYDRNVMGLRGMDAPQKTPTAPSSITMVNLQQALGALESGNAGTTTKFNRNFGANRNGPERVQVKPEFDRTPEVGVTDATKTYPILQQLLDMQTMSTLSL